MLEVHLSSGHFGKRPSRLGTVMSVVVWILSGVISALFIVHQGSGVVHWFVFAFFATAFLVIPIGWIMRWRVKSSQTTSQLG